MRSDFQIRLRILSCFAIFFAAALVARLYFLQVVYGKSFADRADRQYLKSGSEMFDRGSIFFEKKDGNLVSAATLKTGFIVAVNPKLLENASETYEKIKQIFPVDSADYFFKVGKKDDPYEEIAKKVDETAASRIKALGISGLDVYEERWRYYPGDSLASRAVGFVGFKGDKITGLYGLERYYNDILSRKDENVYANFFAELFSNINGVLLKDSSQREGDIVITIEPSIQLALEKKLSQINEKWNSKLSGGVVINPENGEIYAMSVNPSFDLNNFGAVRDQSVFGNPIVENVYEMGSIIKPLTMAAGLDSGAVTADTKYNDKGSVTLNGSTLSNYDKKARGTVDMQEVLNQSLNTGAAFVVSKMGNEAFANYMRAYGLGEETGIDLPGEVHGLADNLKSPRDVEYATASFGQGIAVTPIETVRALSSLGNGGELVTPHLVKKINYRLGDSKILYQNENRRILKKETSEEITRMLVKVVDDALLGGSVKMQNYSIAAKTGTAEIPDTKNGGYYEGRYLHSFFGYFPAYNPRFLVFLYTIEPNARYASETLTHPFMDMAKFLINYYSVPPDR